MNPNFLTRTVRCRGVPGLLAALFAALLTLLPTVSVGLPDDADKPIHITGASAQIDQRSQTLVYKGNVRIDQGTLRVVADTMVVEYRNERVVRIVASGRPARYQQELQSNQGHVHANARTIVYHTQEEALDLEGNAQLVQRGSELTGERIRYDIIAGKVDATANEKGPVRMVLQPARLVR